MMKIDKYGHTFAGFTSTDSINILLTSNGLGIPGRILPGFIASRWLGPLNTAIPTATLVAIILFCWIGVGDSHSGVYIFAFIYGFFASAIQFLFAVSLAALTEDLSQLGTRMGMVFSVVAFASLTGSPVAGALIQADGGTYLGAEIWSGCFDCRKNWANRASLECEDIEMSGAYFHYQGRLVCLYLYESLHAYGKGRFL